MEEKMKKMISSILFMFLISGISFVIFRSDSIGSAFDYLLAIVTRFSIPDANRSGIIYVIIIIILDWVFKNDERSVLKTRNKYFDYFILFIVAVFIFLFLDTKISNQFIYFQF